MNRTCPTTYKKLFARTQQDWSSVQYVIGLSSIHQDGGKVSVEAIQDYNKRVMRVLLFIQQHLDEAMSLSKLAEVANVSQYHFHRLFKGMVGEPVLEHIRRLRLERAALHLKSTERSVSQIAFDAGYETHEAFTRAFKSLFEMSPSNYRKEHRIVPQAHSPSGIHYNTDEWIDGFTSLTEDVQMNEVKVVEREKTRVAFARHIGPYSGVHDAWGKLCGWAYKSGYKHFLDKCVGVCLDDPDVTDANKIRYDACMIIDDEDVKLEEGIDIQYLEGGSYCRMVHVGSFESMDTTYAAMIQKWLPESGYELRDLPSLNFYQNDPDSVPVEELRTEVLIPVKKK